MPHSGALYISERRRGSSNVAGPRVIYPPYTFPFWRACFSEQCGPND